MPGVERAFSPGVAAPFAFADEKYGLRAGKREKTMNSKRKQFGWVLIALALLIVPAAVILLHVDLLTVSMLTLGVAGTVTFTYESFQHTGAYGDLFTGGSATAPTAAQAQSISLMTAKVGFTDTDTTFTFTHNWGLSAAQAAALLPLIQWNIIADQQALGTAVVPNIAWDVETDTNVITATKLADTGSGCTISVAIRRPHSLGF